MILNEAIERYTSNAEYERIHGNLQGCLEFRQLAEWLKDYKRLLEQEPKTGHWRHYEGMLTCSECGAEYYDEIMEYCGDDVPKCCPNCGCRMVESQESEDNDADSN